MSICKFFRDLFSTKHSTKHNPILNIDYVANDPQHKIPTSLDFPPPPNPCPPFAVQGFIGGEAPAGSLADHANQVYISVMISLNMLRRIMGWLFPRWARTQMLICMPRAGRGLNAFYDGNSLRFLYGKHPKTGKIVFTCESADIVSHEAGHAILDAMRPDLWGAQSLEVYAFHESYGDIISIFSALSHDNVIHQVLQETKGNLREHNLVSRVAEEMGSALYGTQALRNALNDFTYTPPERLPQNTPENQLGGDPHNFSRLFTGLIYELIVEMYEQHRRSMSEEDALRLARDHVGTVFFHSVPFATLSPRFYQSVIQAMFAQDQIRGKAIGDTLKRVLNRRKMLFSLGMNIVTLPMHMRSNTEKVRLSEVMSVTGNPLYECLIDIPGEQLLEYGLIDSKTDVYDCAKNCLDYLHNQNKVATEHDIECCEYSHFINDGKLERNLFFCKHHEFSH